MIKFFYKIIGLFLTAFIIFLFIVNYNFLSFKEGIFIKIYYSIKINLIYFIFYALYILIYFKTLHNKK
jgi:hypothetical protein